MEDSMKRYAISTRRISGIELIVIIVFLLYLVSALYKELLYSFIPVNISIILLILLVFLIGIRYFIQPTSLYIGRSYLFFVLFQIIVICSLLYTPAIHIGPEITLRIILLNSYILLPVFVFRNYREIKVFFILFLFVSLFFAFSSIILGNARYLYFTQYIIVGLTLDFAILVSVILFVHSPKNTLFSYLTISLILLVSLFYNEFRTSITILPIAVIFYAIYLLKNNNSNKKRFFYFAGFLLLLVLIIWPFVPKYSLSRLKDMIDAISSQSGNIFSSDYNRFFLWRKAIEMIKQHPFLGGGAGSYSLFVFGKEGLSYPHNIFLESWAEYGILGLLTITIFLVKFLLEVVKTNKKDWIYEIVLTSFLYTFLVAQVHSGLYEQRFLFFSIGLGYAYLNINKMGGRTNDQGSNYN